ncbi:hypothetical protein, partial [Sphingomonas parva]|uniref:hypothetical protein n=1 Tax=Sphingomonas parva TaxID=2555898 RepID=UPI00142FCFC6
LVTLGSATAGDDIDIDTNGVVTLSSAISTGAGADTRAVTFARGAAGTAGAIGFAGPTNQTGHNITIRAASLASGLPITGDTDSGLVLGTLTAGSAQLSAAQGDIRSDSIVAQGPVAVTATLGSVSGRRSGFATGTGGSTISAPGTVTLAVTNSAAAGAVTAGTLTNVGQPAPATLRLRSVTAGAVNLTAGSQLQIGTAAVTGAATLRTTAGTASAAANANVPGYDSASIQAVPAGATISVAAGRVAQLGELDAGQGSVTNGTDQIQVQAQSARIGRARANNGNILLEVGGPLALLGAIETRPGATGAVDPAREVEIRNTGGGTTIVGGTTADTGADLALDDAEMDLVRAGNVVIDSRARPIVFGTLSLASETGATSARFLTTGAVQINGAVSGSGGGVLQIGGSTTLEPAGLGDPATLASQIGVNIGDSGTAGAITFENGTVDLRAQRVVFGRGALLDRYLGSSPLNDTAVAADVANPASALYVGDATGRNFLSAKLLRVRYSNFALFQNTGASLGGGVLLNEQSPPTVNGLALQLYSTGEDGGNSFALFGRVNGFVGRSAGVLPNENLEIADLAGGTRIVRITQANSRVNGCVIGSPDRGCLTTDPPRPNLSIYDERQTQLFGSAEDPGLFFNPLVGRGNEGLIVDIADVPVGIDTIECDPNDATCPARGDQP